MPMSSNDLSIVTDNLSLSGDSNESTNNNLVVTQPTNTAPILPANCRYEVLDEIARSEKGIIYRARDKILGIDVAFKLLAFFEPGSPSAAQFVSGNKIAAQLQHPGVPAVFDLGTLEDGRPFLVMKLIQGRTLSDLLGERLNPVADRIRFLPLFEKVC